MSKIIENIIRQELRQKSLFYPFIADITPRERAVLSLKEQGKTFKVIGKKFGIARQRASQIHQKAKSKLTAQADIIARIALKISQYVFTEREIEEAFLSYLNSDLKGFDVSAKMKLNWIEFNKNLWKLKSKE